MSRQRVAGEQTSAQLHDPIGPVSHGVLATPGQVLFISGQVPVDVDGRLVGPGELGAQYRQVMENMKAIVEDAGGSLDDVCSLVNYVTVPLQLESPEYQELAAVRREYFTSPMPASTLVQVVSLMVPGALVETEAMAVLA